MPHGMNDDLGLRGLVENQIGVRRRRHPADGRIVRAAAHVRMLQQKVGEGPNAGLNAPRALRRMGGDVIEDRAKVGKGRKGIAKPHRPCLAHTARTCSSVANSPRAAAAFEAVIAACSSGVSGTGGSSSPPASRRTTRAMASCAAAGRLRAASSARSRSFVIGGTVIEDFRSLPVYYHSP